MTSPFKIALAGALGGAALAVAIVYAAASFGVLPVKTNDAAIHNYLMAHPELVVAMANKAQAEQDAEDDTARQNAVDALGLKAFFDPKLAYVTGPANAKHSVIEFFDYNCPYCRQSIAAMKTFYAKHKNDTRFAFIEFPFKGPQSTFAARAALAARQQPDKYVPFYFALMSEDGVADENVVMADAQKVGLDIGKLRKDMNASATDETIARAHTLAEAAKIDGTPAFIVDGRIREGAVDGTLLDSLVKG